VTHHTYDINISTTVNKFRNWSLALEVYILALIRHNGNPNPNPGSSFQTHFSPTSCSLASKIIKK
jgi:hypothetical protein